MNSGIFWVVVWFIWFRFFFIGFTYGFSVPGGISVGFCCQWLLLPLLAKNTCDHCRGEIQPCPLACDLSCQMCFCRSWPFSPRSFYYMVTNRHLGQSSAPRSCRAALWCSLYPVTGARVSARQNCLSPWSDEVPFHSVLVPLLNCRLSTKTWM